MEQTKTEFHTHLMGMLTAQEFLKFLSRYLDCIYWPLNEPISKAHQTIPISSALTSKELLDSIRIPHGEQVDYFTLDDMYATRTELLKLAVHSTTIKLNDLLVNEYQDIPVEDKKKIIRQQAEETVYNDYINLCLEELVQQGVEYVEISYSNARRILGYDIEKELKDKITCKFLLSTDRSRTIKNIKQSAKDLKKTLDSGNLVGVDIMGQERPFSLEELDYNNSKSFQKKLETLFTELLQHQDTTLRIHSGETPASNNTIITLKMIDAIARKNDLNIPPPEIRIGHGLHFTKSEEYISLLKKFQCIVEINASSNYSLKNISKYQDIPYDYYLENQIPIVIATDGHGFYDTTIPKEDEIARTNTTLEQYDTIVKTDKDMLEKKVR